MVFSSPIFLFVFLPFVWFVHAVLPERFRKVFLLFASLVFYMYGEGFFVVLMLTTITIAYCSIKLIQAHEKYKTFFASLGTVSAVLILLIFKYANFFTAELSPVLARFGVTLLPTKFHLPLGVSFFTFQAVSCIIDFYRKHEERKVSFIDTALYISFFPQLVAGPIVRYDNFIPQLKYRSVHYAAFLYGLKRFIYGLAKKVLISNAVAPVVDKIFSMESSSMGTSVAWLSALLFGIQLYFDFSGYSDMAIGLARMFGVRIPENFLYPFVATSMGNMWHRWHISLSTWFRDYLYIPLGGNRKGEFRTIVNIWIVFLVCGLWHGAVWHFVLFGAISAFFLTIERIFKKNCSYRSKVLAHLYMMVLVFPAFFLSVRANSVPQFFEILREMYVPASSSVEILRLFDMKSVFALAAGLVFGFPVYGLVTAKFGSSKVFKCLEAVFLIVLFAAALSSNTMVFSDPFIYFRF
ncbi:MBOAT family protein [bacterium]|nr:MBOAT family protein [bacterium]